MPLSNRVNCLNNQKYETPSILLCLLISFGVHAIEEKPNIRQSIFKLNHVGEKKETLLNDPANDYLHDIYNF